MATPPNMEEVIERYSCNLRIWQQTYFKLERFRGGWRWKWTQRLPDGSRGAFNHHIGLSLIKVLWRGIKDYPRYRRGAQIYLTIYNKEKTF